MYLTNRLELDAHIFTQGKYGTLDVPFGGLVDFGLGGSYFWGKKLRFLVTNLVRAVSLKPLGFEISYFNTMLTMDERCVLYKKLKFFVKRLF